MDHPPFLEPQLGPPYASPPEAVDAAPARALDELLLPLLDSCYGLALHLTRNRPDAEDLVQEAVLNAIRGYAGFKPGSNFKAWIFRIIYNCFYSRHRSRPVHRDLVGFEDPIEFYLVRRSLEAGYSVDGTDPVGETIGRLESDEVVSALQALPDEYRVVAALYFLEDLSYQEIAGVLGIPVGTVRSRLHRGRKMLQKRLWRVAEDRGIVGRPRAKDAAGGAVT